MGKRRREYGKATKAATSPKSTMMLFGDAKSFVGELVKELAAARVGA